jgi:hypothetical protein
MKGLITPPGVSIPNENGATSDKNTFLTSSALSPVKIAAP